MKSIKKMLPDSTSVFVNFDLQLDKLEEKLEQINAPPSIKEFEIVLFPLNPPSS